MRCTADLRGLGCALAQARQVPEHWLMWLLTQGPPGPMGPAGSKGAKVSQGHPLCATAAREDASVLACSTPNPGLPADCEVNSGSQQHGPVSVFAYSCVPSLSQDIRHSAEMRCWSWLHSAAPDLKPQDLGPS